MVKGTLRAYGASMTLVTDARDSLRTTLERFNRKERFILFEQATAGTGRVTLHDGYGAQLGAAIGQSIPAGHLLMVDYHLNWLYAALELHAGNWSTAQPGVRAAEAVPAVNVPDGDLRHALERNQEDIDLLVVWEEDKTTHVALVEAKAHTGWTNKQMRSKAARLQAIFGDGGTRYRDVTPHFALTSFAASKKLTTTGWPEWMLTEGGVAHVELMKPEVPRLMVGEVDEAGAPKAGGGFFGIRE